MRWERPRPRRAVDAVWRDESARVVAGLARVVRDVGLAEGLAQDALVSAALHRAEALGGSAGPYTLQAAIAACHARAGTAEETDWGRIAALYAELARVMPSPVVELNRAVAVSRASGPRAGLDLVDALATEPTLERYHLLPSVRGDLLAKLDRFHEAGEEFQRARAHARAHEETDMRTDATSVPGTPRDHPSATEPERALDRPDRVERPAQAGQADQATRQGLRTIRALLACGVAAGPLCVSLFRWPLHATGKGMLRS